MKIKKGEQVKAEARIKWQMLRKEECCREELRQALGGSEVLPDEWESTAEVVRGNCQ